MYKVDRAAAAVPSLVTHSGWVATGLYVFELHASRPAVHIVAGCRQGRLSPLTP